MTTDATGETTQRLERFVTTLRGYEDSQTTGADTLADLSLFALATNEWLEVRVCHATVR